VSTADAGIAEGGAVRVSAAGAEAVEWAWLDTPAGPVSVGCNAAGVARVRFGMPDDAAVRAAARSMAATARAQLAEYFCGSRRSFELPIDWSVLVAAQRQVLTTLTDSVGYGQTISYGSLARMAGLMPTADTLPARVVGQIMASNPIPVIVPCHRVLASDGLGGYSGGAGIEVKRWLLILEGSLPPTLDWQPAQPVTS
jgi:methylated-DNA-[protein]-cysteine S-methyltransferase